MGLSFGEILVLAILAMVVIGPKDLPKLLRTVGRFLGQARRAIADVKRETGLDDVLRGDFEDLARLADHIEDMGGASPPRALPTSGELPGFRLREYPPIGADSSALLPEDAGVYADGPTFGANAEIGAVPRVPTLLGTHAPLESSRADKASP
ncbi:MAG: Sec-independent protein translocase protein TatB [Polyangiales bacterium]